MTSEAPDQSPEVEAHIWAGISAGTHEKMIIMVTVSINCIIVQLMNAIFTSEYAGGVSV